MSEDTSMCEICEDNEADFTDHFEEHIPNPRKIDACSSCHGKIHTGWKWIMRDIPNACPLHKSLSDPDELRKKYDVDGDKIVSIEDGVCWYPNQFYTDMVKMGKNKINDHPCSEIENQLNKSEENYDFRDCHIFSKWYFKRYFETLEGLDE